MWRPPDWTHRLFDEEKRKKHDVDGGHLGNISNSNFGPKEQVRGRDWRRDAIGTGDKSVLNLLALFDDCRRRGEIAHLHLETRCKRQFASFSVETSAGLTADWTEGPRTSTGTGYGYGSTKPHKSPATRRRDWMRLERRRLGGRWAGHWDTPPSPVVTPPATLGQQNNYGTVETVGDIQREVLSESSVLQKSEDTVTFDATQGGGRFW